MEGRMEGTRASGTAPQSKRLCRWVSRMKL